MGFYTKLFLLKAGDVYSFAMTVFEIVTAETPFGKCSFKKLCTKLMNGERPILNSLISDSYKSLIERCWSQDPKDRPTFGEIVDELQLNKDFISGLIDENQYLN